MTRLDILVVDDTYVLATWGRTFIQIWRGAPKASTTARMHELSSAFVASSSLPATSLFIVEAKSPSPDEASRKILAAFSRDVVGRMSLSVVVAEGGGFRGALVRAVGVALTTILPHRSRFKFVDDVATAAELLGPHLLAGSGGPEALLRVAAEARSKLPSVAA